MKKEPADGGIAREGCASLRQSRTEDGAPAKGDLPAQADGLEDLQEKWESAGIGNDYIFSCVMRDEDLFLQLMQRVFPKLHLTKVWKHTTQKTFLAMQVHRFLNNRPD